MKTANKPELITLKTGVLLTVLKVTGQAGMQMPLHYSTKEAVLIVQEGSAALVIMSLDSNIEFVK
jgi:quercetin dioxygenase-like cupin family protein